MIGRRHLPEATLATLDLALVWLDVGRGAEVSGLVEELAAAFAGSPGLDLALDGLAQPGEDAAAGRLSPQAWGAMAPDPPAGVPTSGHSPSAGSVCLRRQSRGGQVTCLSL